MGTSRWGSPFQNGQPPCCLRRRCSCCGRSVRLKGGRAVGAWRKYWTVVVLHGGGFCARACGWPHRTAVLSLGVVALGVSPCNHPSAHPLLEQSAAMHRRREGTARWRGAGTPGVGCPVRRQAQGVWRSREARGRFMPRLAGQSQVILGRVLLAWRKHRTSRVELISGEGIGRRIRRSRAACGGKLRRGGDAREKIE